MRTRLTTISLLAALLSGNAGCMSLTRAQIERKLPKIDGDTHVEVNTIYGVSGTLDEEGVKWTGDDKKVKSSVLRITSPLGSYKRTVKGTIDAK